MGLAQFADWLDQTPFSTMLKTEFWIVPTLQSIHILSVCLVFTGAVVVCLRAWRVMGTDWTPQLWARRLYPTQWWALLALVATGTLQVLAEPPRELTNFYFQTKMVGVLLAALLALWLSRRFYREEADSTPAILKAASLLLMLLWGAIMFAGRWIAYA